MYHYKMYPKIRSTSWGSAEVETERGIYQIGITTKDLDVICYETIPWVPNSNIAFSLDYVEGAKKWQLYYYALNGLEIIRKTTINVDTALANENILLAILERLREWKFFE